MFYEYFSFSQASESRIALVIGNSSYPTSPLINPSNDAKDVALILKQLNFEVIEQKDAKFLEMEKAVREFGNRLRQSKGIGLFFYAGHGIQVNGRNYLIPVDADIQDEIEVKHKSLDVDLILGKMELAENDVNLLILDACRNNPFERRFRSGIGRGLAQMSAPSGTVIWYATRPGKIAFDGKGRNSPFTRHLLNTLGKDDIKAREVISRIAVAMREEGIRQEPWQEGIWLNDFYFSQTTSATLSDSAAIKSTKNNNSPKVEALGFPADKKKSKVSTPTKTELAKIDKQSKQNKDDKQHQLIGKFPDIMGVYGGTGTIASYTAATSGGVRQYWNATNTILDQNLNGVFQMELEASSMLCEGEGKFSNENEISGLYKCRCRGAEFAFCSVNFGNTHINLKFKGKLSKNLNEIEFNYSGVTKESNHSTARVIIKERTKALRKK